MVVTINTMTQANTLAWLTTGGATYWLWKAIPAYTLVTITMNALQQNCTIADL